MKKRLELIAWINFICWIIQSIAFIFKLSEIISLVLVAVCAVTLGYNMYNLISRKNIDERKAYRKRMIYQMILSLGIMILCMLYWLGYGK